MTVRELRMELFGIDNQDAEITPQLVEQLMMNFECVKAEAQVKSFAEYLGAVSDPRD
jgi:hypothetical protein